jgi:hypothetical protein
VKIIVATLTRASAMTKEVLILTLVYVLTAKHCTENTTLHHLMVGSCYICKLNNMIWKNLYWFYNHFCTIRFFKKLIHLSPVQYWLGDTYQRRAWKTFPVFSWISTYLKEVTSTWHTNIVYVERWRYFRATWSLIVLFSW